MKIRLALYALTAFAIAGGLLFWGTQEPDSPAWPTSEHQQLVDRNQARIARFQEALSTYRTCTRELRPLLQRFQRFHSRLSVGLVFQDYTAAVGDLRVGYDRVRWRLLDSPCITDVGEPIRKSFNEYVAANERWNDCIGDLYCNLDDIDPQLQKDWNRATRYMNDAQRGLRTLRPSF